MNGVEQGRRGEDLAVAFLLEQGYRILQRNWREKTGEIDIIAETDEFIVFVEVKTRTTALFGNPEDFVGNARMRRMVE